MILFLRRIAARGLLAVLDGVQLVLRALVQLFRIVLWPFAVLGRGLFLALLPVYRLWLWLKRTVARFFEGLDLLRVLFHRGLAFAAGLGFFAMVLVGVVFRDAARAETYGSDMPLFALLQGEQASDVVVHEVRYGVDTERVTAYLGQTALLPDTPLPMVRTVVREAATTEVAAAPAASTRAASSTYIVRSGDNLWMIAQQFGVDVNSLMAANGLGPNDYVRPGDVLTILPGSGLMHTVARGDTWLGIAKQYAVSAEAVAGANGKTTADVLSIGAKLFVPGGRLLVAKAPTTSKPAAVATKPATTAPPVQSLFKEPEKPAASTATGSMVWPTSGKYVTQYYGLRHTGIDIDGQIGAPIYASGDGVVEFAGWATGYGLSLVVDHGNGLWTRYGHNSKIYVKVGDTVKKGDTIALMGTTGQSTGSHLHFEVFTGPGKFVNPLKYVR